MLDEESEKLSVASLKSPEELKKYLGLIKLNNMDCEYTNDIPEENFLTPEQEETLRYYYEEVVGEIKKEQDFVDWVEDLTWEEIYDITN